jgi:membrane-bound ClpP family serine protease
MSQAPLPPDVAKRLYLRFLILRLAGLAVMALGMWLIRTEGQAVGLGVVLLGGATLFVRPKHLGLTRK